MLRLCTITQRSCLICVSFFCVRFGIVCFKRNQASRNRFRSNPCASPHIQSNIFRFLPGPEIDLQSIRAFTIFVCYAKIQISSPLYPRGLTIDSVKIIPILGIIVIPIRRLKVKATIFTRFYAEVVLCECQHPVHINFDIELISAACGLFILQKSISSIDLVFFQCLTHTVLTGTIFWTNTAALTKAGILTAAANSRQIYRNIFQRSLIKRCGRIKLVVRFIQGGIWRKPVLACRQSVRCLNFLIVCVLTIYINGQFPRIVSILRIVLLPGERSVISNRNVTRCFLQVNCNRKLATSARCHCIGIRGASNITIFFS